MSCSVRAGCGTFGQGRKNDPRQAVVPRANDAGVACLDRRAGECSDVVLWGYVQRNATRGLAGKWQNRQGGAPLTSVKRQAKRRAAWAWASKGKGRDPFVQPRPLLLSLGLDLLRRPSCTLHAVALLVKLGLAGLTAGWLRVLVRNKHAATGKKRGRP